MLKKAFMSVSLDMKCKKIIIARSEIYQDKKDAEKGAEAIPKSTLLESMFTVLL